MHRSPICSLFGTLMNRHAINLNDFISSTKRTEKRRHENAPVFFLRINEWQARTHVFIVLSQKSIVFWCERFLLGFFHIFGKIPIRICLFVIIWVTAAMKKTHAHTTTEHQHFYTRTCKHTYTHTHTTRLVNKLQNPYLCWTKFFCENKQWVCSMYQRNNS